MISIFTSLISFFPYFLKFHQKVEKCGKKRKKGEIQNKFTLFYTFLHFFTLFYTFLHFFTLFYTFLQKVIMGPHSISNFGWTKSPLAGPNPDPIGGSSRTRMFWTRRVQNIVKFQTLFETLRHVELLQGVTHFFATKM